ncbi:MAG: hypothetical protein GY853_06475 [PVC group bacterium]|nr:hypothetical protein [PVC group bacterium]
MMKNKLLYSVIICLLVVIVLLLGKAFCPVAKSKNAKRSWSSEQMREYANKLKSDGLTYQAAEAFEEYLGKSNETKQTRSNIYYSIGEMFIKAKQHEDALGYFYKAEIANSETELKKEIGTYIVECLENMGKSLDAEYQLESRAALQGEEKEKKASGEVVAQVGSREIYMGEINAEIERLPDWLKKKYTENEAEKLTFVEQYVARELLYDKGKKLGFTRDEAIRKQLDEVAKELVVQKVLKKHIRDNISKDPKDIENYYTANKERYAEKAKVQFKHILVEKEEEAKKILEEIEAGADFAKLAKEKSLDKATKESGGAVSGWINKDGSVPGVGDDPDFQKALFALAKNAKQVIKSTQGFHVVQITEKQEYRLKPYKEIEKQVGTDYLIEKEQYITQALLNDILQKKNVVIYRGKFVGKEKKQKVKTEE